MSKKKLRIFSILVLICILLLFLFCYYRKNFLREKPIITIPNVKVSRVINKEEEIIYELPARVVSKYKIEIKSRLAGYIEKSYFNEGDFVKENDILLLIEPSEYINKSQSEKYKVNQTKSELEYLVKQYERANNLVTKGYIAQYKFDEIKAQMKAKEAELQANEFSYKDSLRNLKYTLLKSPITGKIGVINISVGNYVNANSDTITTIYSTDPIYITYAMNIEDYNYIKKIDGKTDKKVELYYEDGTKFENIGVQNFSNNNIDKTTNTITLRATFRNKNNELVEGQYIKIKLYLNKKQNRIEIPVMAVQSNAEGTYVYIVKNNIAYLKYIKIEKQKNNFYTISSGLNNDDYVIIEGLQKVIPGHEVNIIK